MSVSKRRNERLRQAIHGQGQTMQDLAAAVHVNLKTVQRWYYEGRVPRRKSRIRVGLELQIDPEWLWPTGTPPTWAPDLANMYAQFDHVPSSLWRYLALTAEHRIDIACDDLLPWGRELASALARQAASGIPVRVCSHSMVEALLLAGADVRLPSDRQAFGVFRFDNAMLVWLRDNDIRDSSRRPVLHLARANGVIFDTYVDDFNARWEAGSIATNDAGDWLQTA